MSASNWTTCPRCVEEAAAAAFAEQQRVADLYGKVSVEEFDRERAALRPADPTACETFREDYEFYGARNGKVTADYRGHCEMCGLGLNFKVEKTFWAPPAPGEAPSEGAGS